MKKTKIICTLGPSVDDEKILNDIINAGMDVARFNFSHGDHESQQERVDRVRKVIKENDKDVALLLDTKGPEIRIGKFENNAIVLNEGEFFVLYNKDMLGNQDGVSISHKELYKDMKPGKVILINDGVIELVVVNVDGKDIVCKIINGGVVSNNKGVNIPDTDTHLPSLTEQDIKDIEFAIKNDFDFIAASFVRKVDDVLAVREVLSKHNANNIKIISKIENREGVNNFDEILAVSDGIMVARGDLGVEIPFEEIPALQKKMCEKCNEQHKIVIVATQMLESMINNVKPTRAEVSDVANAIYDGASAIMLSGESAAGKYPVESVQTMAKVAAKTERAIASDMNFTSGNVGSIGAAIALSSVVSAEIVDASVIVCLTESGKTAKTISFNKPSCPILAITHDDKVVRELMLTWGVYPIKLDDNYDIEHIFDIGIDNAMQKGLAVKGDTVVITSGENISKEGSTNILRICEI